MNRLRLQLTQKLTTPGWTKFLLALLALIVAFLLAVYSSVFAREGRVIATAVCASLALLLSGFVAITAVPYLARRSRLEWVRVSMDYRLTREGWVFIGLILLIAVAGLNTGNNLLYLILSSMLASILVSGFLSLAVLNGVEMQVLLPGHVFARRRAEARVRMMNLKKWIPSFSLTLQGAGTAKQQKTGKRWRWRKKGSSQPAADSPDRREHILQQSLYFPELPAARSINRVVELEFPRRGHYQEKAFTLSTRFPFGFLEKSLQIPVSEDLWVYPAVGPTEEFYEILPMLSGELEAYQKGRGHDLYSIRDLLPTDDARHVDWKASARVRKLKVREFAREDERRLQLILDPRIGPASRKGLEQFEAAVEFCACLAWHFHEVDAQLQFRCGEFQTVSARAGEIIYDILRFLAEVDPSVEVPNYNIFTVDHGSEFRIVCTALPRGAVPTNVWSGAYFIFFNDLRPKPAGQLPEKLTESAGNLLNK